MSSKTASRRRRAAERRSPGGGWPAADGRPRSRETRTRRRAYAPLAGSRAVGQARATPIRAAAHQQGFPGRQAPRGSEAAAQIEAMIASGPDRRRIGGLRQTFRHEAEEDVVELALAIARRILHRELTVAPEALLGLLKAALEKIELREVHRVRVSPRRRRRWWRSTWRRWACRRPIEVIADPGLPRGAAILDSSRGALDASVETQLAEIERGFADLVRRD